MRSKEKLEEGITEKIRYLALVELLIKESVLEDRKKGLPIGMTADIWASTYDSKHPLRQSMLNIIDLGVTHQNLLKGKVIRDDDHKDTTVKQELLVLPEEDPEAAGQDDWLLARMGNPRAWVRIINNQIREVPPDSPSTTAV